MKSSTKYYNASGMSVGVACGLLAPHGKLWLGIVAAGFIIASNMFERLAAKHEDAGE